MDSWFKCFHKLKESAVFKNSELLHVWIWCLLSAKYFKCSTVFYSGKRTESISLTPGQFVFGRKAAAKELNMTESGFYKRLKKLESMQNVILKSNNRYTVVTVLNWNIYQGSNYESDGNRQKATFDMPICVFDEKGNSDSNNKNNDDCIINSDSYIDENKKSNNESNINVTTKEQQGNTINRSNKKDIDKNISVLDKPKRISKKSELSPELQESFLRFWSAYPKHQAKVTAEKAWMKISPQNGLVETICASIEKFKQSPGWKKDNGQFIPMPSTWLNQRRWEDEILQVSNNLDLEYWKSI